jgi:subtilisin family serine protease
MQCPQLQLATVCVVFGILGGLVNGSARAAAQMPAPAAGDYRASVAPSLVIELAALGDQDTIRVILFMKEQAPIEELSRQLRAEGASQKERHERVVRALQSAATSKAELLSELAQARLAGAVKSYQGYWIANFVEVTATREYLFGLLGRSDIASMQPIVRAEPLLPEETIPEGRRSGGGRLDRGASCGLIAINADKVWKMGINGAGTLVANLDTGVDGDHSALASRWRGVGGQHPASECWRDKPGGSHPNFPYDYDDHGTGTMGIMAGMGGPLDSIGVAWGASWIAAQYGSISGSLQWLIDPDGNPETSDDRPDVINCSFFDSRGGCPDPVYGLSPILDNIQAAGTAVIWAVGNCGDSQGVYHPDWYTQIAFRDTTVTKSFSVGSVDAEPDCEHPSLGYWSSCRGPSTCGASPEVAIKPEVSAPGKLVKSARAGGGYVLATGTSEAAPHVAGVIALMRQANPEIEVEAMLEILMQSARDIAPTGEDNTTGWGLIDAEQAVLIAQRHITVRPDGTGQYPTIQAAINAAQDGWTIDLANGWWLPGLGNENINFLGKAIVVRALGGPDSCVIRGPGSGNGSGFVFNHQEGHDSVLDGVTIEGFFHNSLAPPLTGGISIHASSPTIRNCVFRGNNNAIHADGGAAAVFEKCTFTNNNSLWTEGSAALLSNTGCEMRDCVFEHNFYSPEHISASIVSWYGSLSLTRCRFSVNGDTDHSIGGAIEAHDTNLIATDCVFEDNSAYAGGAIGWYSNSGTSLILTRCTFDHNTCVDGGSAIHAIGSSGGGVATLDHCILSFGSAGAPAFRCTDMTTPPTLICCDVFGNGTDYSPGCLSGAWNVNGNFALDPLHCPEDLTLQPNSPCAAGNSTCGQVGALPVGCLIQTGACCPTSESCEVTLESQCTGRWVRDLACSPNPCPDMWLAVEERPTEDHAGITTIAPNPASGIARIRYDLAGGGEYRLEVFNSAGQFVRRLGSGPLSIGAHDIDWDARDDKHDRVPAGVYFVRLTQGRRWAASPLIIVR